MYASTNSSMRSSRATPRRRQPVAVQIEQQVAGQKRFEDEPVIRGRLLEVDAVCAWSG